MEIPKKIFLVWNEEDQYTEQYDSLEDAVSEGYETEEKPYVEVYEAIPKRLGKYTQTVGVKKLKD